MIKRLFYKSVYKSDDVYPMDDNLSKVLNIHRTKVYDNVSNATSNDTYVLNSPLCSELKSWLHGHLVKFFYDYYKIDKEVKMYITQSWLNFTENGEHHHHHNHPNSIISGVFYFTGEDLELRFHNDQELFKGFQFNTNGYTEDNSDTYTVEFSSGQLVLFPSHMKHDVPKFKGKLRISLAFNTFIKGDIGSLPGLTKVEI